MRVYAIIKSGGKQYRVSPGDVVYLERVDAEDGASLSLAEVLMVGGEGDPRVGTPLLEKACVRGTVVEQGRDSKIRVFKFKRRKQYKRTRGHRQAFTAVRIDAIEA